MGVKDRSQRPATDSDILPPLPRDEQSYVPHDNHFEDENMKPVTITLPCKGDLSKAGAGAIRRLAPTLNKNGFVASVDENSGTGTELTYYVSKPDWGKVKGELGQMMKDGRLQADPSKQEGGESYRLAGDEGFDCGLPTNAIGKSSSSDIKR